MGIIPCSCLLQSCHNTRLRLNKSHDKPWSCVATAVDIEPTTKHRLSGTAAPPASCPITLYLKNYRATLRLASKLKNIPWVGFCSDYNVQPCTTHTQPDPPALCYHRLTCGCFCINWNLNTTKCTRWSHATRVTSLVASIYWDYKLQAPTIQLLKHRRIKSKRNGLAWRWWHNLFSASWRREREWCSLRGRRHKVDERESAEARRCCRVDASWARWAGRGRELQKERINGETDKRTWIHLRFLQLTYMQKLCL
jgi:hypothetical protein